MPSRGPAGQGALPGPSLQDLLSEKAVTPPADRPPLLKSPASGGTPPEIQTHFPWCLSDADLSDKRAVSLISRVPPEVLTTNRTCQLASRSL